MNNNADIVSMIGNLSQSLVPVQTLIAGLGYLIGIFLVITAVTKLKKIGDYRSQGSSGEKMFVPIAYLIGGAALIFLPSALKVLSSTAFGTGNILQYTPYNPYNVYASMKILIQTAGLIWFIRGAVLLVHASEPGVKEGPKGLAFIVAGILAVNFEGTVGAVNFVIEHLMSLTKPSK